MKNLIVECYKGGKGLMPISESANIDGLIPVPEGMMRVEGIVAVVDVLNRNNRKYGRDHYRTLIESLQSIIKGDGLFGEMEHPSSMNINNNNISHKIERLWLEEETGNVMATMLLLSGEKGKIAQDIVRSGGALRASSRGAGEMVGESVNLSILSTYDLVGTAGFKQSAIRAKFESKDTDGEILMESYDFGSLEQESTKVNESKQEIDLDKLKNDIVESVLKQIKPTESNIDENSIIEKVTDSVLKSVNEKQDLFVSDVETFIESLDTKTHIVENEGDNAQSTKELVREMLVNEFAPNLEKWLTTEFAEGIQDWTTTHFAEGIQNWVVTEFAEGLETWFLEAKDEKEEKEEDEDKGEKSNSKMDSEEDEEKPKLKKDKDEDGEKEETVKESKKDVYFQQSNEILSKITERLSAISTRYVNESSEETTNILNETFGEKAKLYLQHIPNHLKLVYMSLDENAKGMIENKASLRKLDNAERIDEFWATLPIGTFKTEGAVLPKRTNQRLVENKKEEIKNNRSQLMEGASMFAKKLRTF